MTIADFPVPSVDTRLPVASEDLDGLLTVPLRHLLAFANPLEADVWGCGAITRADVLSSQQVAANHRGAQIRRIRHFLAQGVDPADPYPVTVDVGIFDYWPTWPILDGNHRVAAAAILGLPHLQVQVGGDWDRAVEILQHGHLPD